MKGKTWIAIHFLGALSGGVLGAVIGPSNRPPAEAEGGASTATPELKQSNEGIGSKDRGFGSIPPFGIPGEEFVTIHRSQWNRPFLQTLKPDLTLTKESAEYFGLTDNDVLRVNARIKEFENQLAQRELANQKGLVTKNGIAVFKVEPWNDDYDSFKEELHALMRTAFNSEADADLFAEQSHKTIAAAYGDFGTKPKLMKVLRNGKDSRFQVMVATGGNVDQFNLEDLSADPGMKFIGVKIRHYEVPEFPNDWKRKLNN